MQPYQAATEETRRQAQVPKKLLGHAATAAASIAVGGPLVSRILPLINKFVPGELMRKGLSKVEPRIGKFVDTAINNGFSLDDVRSFMEEKFSPKQEQQEPEQQQSNPLQDFETTYPDIAQGLANTMQQGQSPQAAAGILKTSSAFGKQIKKLEKEIGKNFVDYIVELFGPMMQQNQGQQMQQQQMQQQPQQQPQMQQSGQEGGLDNQLLAALDKILKM